MRKRGTLPLRLTVRRCDDKRDGAGKGCLLRGSLADEAEVRRNFEFQRLPGVGIDNSAN